MSSFNASSALSAGFAQDGLAPPGSPDTRSLDGDRIVATLHRLGVRYIVAEDDAESYDDLPPAQLIAAMICNGGIRVQYAVISLLLRHPEFAAVVPGLVATLPDEKAALLQRHYTAAVYLQRMYCPALEIYLGGKPDLPDYFSAEMDLPSPNDYYGVTGLRELVNRLPPPIDWWGSYLHPVKMLIRFLSWEKTYGWDKED